MVRKLDSVLIPDLRDELTAIAASLLKASQRVASYDVELASLLVRDGNRLMDMVDIVGHDGIVN